LGQFYGPSYAQKIVNRVNALPHDIIFIGGDLYDGTGAPDIAELAAPLGGFTGHLGIYFITGNHEEFGQSDAFIAAVRSARIRPLIDEMVEIDGLQLVGVDYKNSADKESFKAILSRLALDPAKPSILLKHEPKDIDVAREAGVSFQISGHTHKAQMWPLGYIADLIYKGYAYGLKQSGNMHVLTSSGVGTWGPPMRVGTDCEIVHITFS
jgi:predicted MPP superfamily phosphohydrolase